MNIFEATKQQLSIYSSQIDLILTKGALTATVKGIKSDHNLGIDAQTGNLENVQNAHASFSLSNLILAGFSGDVVGVFLEDPQGNYYKIVQQFNSKTTGFIVCILKTVEKK
jgi:hypothetical protein